MRSNVFSLPTYEEYLKIAMSVEEMGGIEDFFRNKLDSSSYQYVKGFKVLPLISDPTNEDTDGDNLTDGEEYEYILWNGVIFDNIGLTIHTNPISADSDGDGLKDDEDPYKLQKNTYDRYDRKSAVNYAFKWFNGRNPEFREYPYDCANFVSQCLFNGYLSMDENWHCYYNGVKSYWDFVLSIDELKYIFKHKEKYLENWDITDSWNSAKEQYELFSKPLYSSAYFEINNYEELKSLLNKENISVGDLVYCDTPDVPGDPNHAAIITEVNDIEIKYAAHSSDIKYRSVKDLLNENDKNKVYIVIMKDIVIYS